MSKYEKILTWLNGKKSTILAISAAVLSYCVAGGLIDPQLGALLQTILSILTGGAVFETKRLGIKKN
jgi:hypothetical protein